MSAISGDSIPIYLWISGDSIPIYLRLSVFCLAASDFRGQYTYLPAAFENRGQIHCCPINFHTNNSCPVLH